MPNLIITMALGDRVRVGPDCWVTFVERNAQQVKLAFAAPLSVKILRERLILRDEALAAAGGV